MKKDNTWKCKDLYLASFIYSKGQELLGVERDGRTCWFEFTNESVCKALQTLYWTNKGDTIPKIYSDAIRSLKDLIYAT